MNMNVVHLTHHLATDVSMFGAKAANLAKAVQLGYDVPDGLAISRICTEDEFSLMAHEIITELSSPIAVRSSASKEDSASKAFAGQFETCLGVNSSASLINAFSIVKNSGATDHVKNYYGEVIPQEQIGVLIQCMVSATRAGIAFSRDPINGNQKIIIESSYGLGKSVVDGEVTPDSIEYLNDGTYKTFIGHKSTMIVLGEGGILTQNTPSLDTERCSLSDDEIKRIAELAKKIEHDFGFPADIEWAIDDAGKIWILQARPITTVEVSGLPPLPKPPEGVQLVLKCLQSVLNSDLSFRGNRASVFRRIYGIDFAFEYFVYNCGEKYFDSTSDRFCKQLSTELNPDVVAQKYITAMGRNARKLIRTAQIVSSPTRWRKSYLRQDLLEDLTSYWDAYEEHSTAMPTFWIVEPFVVNALINELRKSGYHQEVDDGLPSFIMSSEPNWFALEQKNIEVLKSRFANESDNQIESAASFHADTFGIWYTPYNLGTPPSTDKVLANIKQPSVQSKCDIEPLDRFPKHIIRLGELVRELAFWKSERVDILSIADHYATPMYEMLSDLLELPRDLIYYMTRDEITWSIKSGHGMKKETLKQRSEAYCMALVNGTISFYQPAGGLFPGKRFDVVQNGDVLKGKPTAPGVVRGKVKLVGICEDNPTLQPDEIIVTSMTRPEFGVALDVALAYVTNEGGLLCHAAIVSRERKKPCVTGLGNITEVLSDGMIIEVNGFLGSVTIIESFPSLFLSSE